MDLSEQPHRAFRRHPWEVARRDFFRRVLADAGALGAGRVLDVGAGDAWFSRELRPSLPADATVVCWDANYTADVIDGLTRASDGGLGFTTTRPEGRFDLVILLDVLEHVEDDRGFLSALTASNLAPGATVLVSVPAWPLLTTSHDTRLGHHRRYRPGRCAALLSDAGLRIERSGGLFHALMAPRFASRVAETLRGVSPDGAPDTLEWRAGRWVTRAVSLALAADNAVSVAASRVGVQLPGLSYWAVARAR